MIFFTKMQATGNDFVIIDLLKQKINYDLKIFSKFLCNRNISVGADGVIFLLSSNIVKYKMKIYNADGSEANMCGNGIRCLAKYIKQNYEDINELRIETKSGVKFIEINDEITVNMNKPIIDEKKIPIFISKESKENVLQIEGYEFYYISVGNPHVVCFVENVDDIDIEIYGKKIENYKYFPNRINVEFVQIINGNEIKIRVWERGVGETLSCGTGACASTYIGIKEKHLNNEVTVHLRGGILNVLVNENNEIFLKGNAEFCFEGKIENL